MAYYATNEITGSTTAVALTGIQTLRHSSVISTEAGDLVEVTGTIIFASGVNPAINDLIELAVLPADHVPVDFILSNDDFDSNGTPTITIKLGLMTGTVGDAGRVLATVGVEGIASGSTLLQAPAYTRCALATFQQIAPSTLVDRSIGLGIVASAATNPATIRRIDFQLFYRAARYGA
jgi:hypothetical protein